MVIQYTRNLHQDFVYWEYDGPGQVGSSVILKSPVEIKGRYDFETVVQRAGEEEEELNWSSIVLDCPIKAKSYIMEGLISDLDDPDVDPQLLDDAWRVKEYKETFSTNGIIRESMARVFRK